MMIPPFDPIQATSQVCFFFFLATFKAKLYPWERDVNPDSNKNQDTHFTSDNIMNGAFFSLSLSIYLYPTPSLHLFISISSACSLCRFIICYTDEPSRKPIVLSFSIFFTICLSMSLHTPPSVPRFMFLISMIRVSCLNFFHSLTHLLTLIVSSFYCWTKLSISFLATLCTWVDHLRPIRHRAFTTISLFLF